MPQAPNYPIIDIWDSLYNIFSNDVYFQTKLAKVVESSLALYKIPLTQETIVFSDSGYAIGIGYFLEKTIDLQNGLGIILPTFKIDIAVKNEDFHTACVDCEKFSTDIQYSVEASDDINPYGRVISESITPTEPVRSSSFWTTMQTYNFKIFTTNIYKWN